MSRHMSDQCLLLTSLFIRVVTAQRTCEQLSTPARVWKDLSLFALATQGLQRQRVRAGLSGLVRPRASDGGTPTSAAPTGSRPRLSPYISAVRD